MLYKNSNKRLSSIGTLKIGFKLYILILTYGFIVSSCSVKNPPIQDQLIPSSTNVHFTAKGGEKKLQVLSSTQWEYYFPEEIDWLNVEKIGDSLIVNTGSNDGAARRAYVLLHAGNSTSKIQIDQERTIALYTMDRDHVIFPTKGGQEVVKISGYTGVLKFELEDSAKDWLEYSYSSTRQEITFTTKGENREFSRNALLIIRNEDTTREISITQRGAKAWFIPVRISSASESGIVETIQREVERGNRLISEEKEGTYTTLLFGSQSTLFSDYTYRFSSGNQYVSVKTTLLNTSEEALKSYKQSLIDEKYVLNSSLSNQYITSFSSLSQEEEVTIEKVLEGYLITFTREESQPMSYKTFKKYPFVDEAIGKWSLSDIEKYEREYYNTYTPAYQKGNDYYYTHTDISPYTYLYSLDENGILAETWITTDRDLNKVIWFSGTKWKLTNEFTQLISTQGYTLKAKSLELVTYTNSEQGLAIDIQYSDKYGKYLYIKLYKAE